MSWLDDLARSAARRDGMNRRDLLKRAGVVGAATVWAAPVLQSVLAPPAQAQYGPAVCAPSDSTLQCGGDCPTRCGTGGVCDGGADCLSGTCTSGQCAAGLAGDPCLVGPDCVTGLCAGTCQQAPAGGTCASGSDCVTGSCTGGTCDPAPNGGPCTTTLDCADRVAHLAICSSGVCKARGGGVCTTNGDCQSNDCNTGLGTCRGQSGDPCASSANCVGAVPCVANVCV